MAIRFYKLLDLLNKRKMSKKELQKLTKLSSATIAKFSSGKKVSLSLEAINKVCRVLECQPADIMEFEPDENE